MKTGKIGRILAVCIGASLLTGCGGEKQNTYRQAEENLAQGSYQEALTGYETSVSYSYKTVESLRGAGIAKLRLGDYQGAVAVSYTHLDVYKRQYRNGRRFFIFTAELPS